MSAALSSHKTVPVVAEPRLAAGDYFYGFSETTPERGEPVRSQPYEHRSFNNFGMFGF